MKQATWEIKRLMDYNFALLITHVKNTLKSAKEKVKALLIRPSHCSLKRP